MKEDTVFQTGKEMEVREPRVSGRASKISIFEEPKYDLREIRERAEEELGKEFEVDIGEREGFIERLEDRMHVSALLFAEDWPEYGDGHRAHAEVTVNWPEDIEGLKKTTRLTEKVERFLESVYSFRR